MPGEDPRQAGQAVSGGSRDSGAIGRPRQAAARGAGARSRRSGCSRASSAAAALVAESGACAGNRRRQGRLLVQHGRGDAARDVCRRHGRGAPLGDLSSSASGHARRPRISNCAAASPTSMPRCSAPMRCSTCATSASIVWNNDNKKPELVGTLPAESGAPDERAAFLAFGRWLMPRSAAALEHAIAALREKAVGLRPRHRGAERRAAGGAGPQERRPCHRALPVAVRDAAHAGAAETRKPAACRRPRQHARPDRRARTCRSGSAAADGRLKWVNRAYAAAVEAADPEAAIRDGKEFLGTPGARGDRQAASVAAGLPSRRCPP